MPSIELHVRLNCFAFTKFDTIRCQSSKLEEHLGNPTQCEKRLLRFDEISTEGVIHSSFTCDRAKVSIECRSSHPRLEFRYARKLRSPWLC